MALLERDAAQTEAQRWARRMTLLEARLEKIRELLGADLRAENPTEELSGATLSMLRETHRLAPPPFLPLEEWTQAARSAAADFYQIAHAALPALIARAGERTAPEAPELAQRAESLEGQLRNSQLTEAEKEVPRGEEVPATTEELIAILGI